MDTSLDEGCWRGGKTGNSYKRSRPPWEWNEAARQRLEKSKGKTCFKRSWRGGDNWV